MGEGRVGHPGVAVGEHGVAVTEGPASAVLSAQAHGVALGEQRRVGEVLRGGPVRGRVGLRRLGHFVGTVDLERRRGHAAGIGAVAVEGALPRHQREEAVPERVPAAAHGVPAPRGPAVDVQSLPSRATSDGGRRRPFIRGWASR